MRLSSAIKIFFFFFTSISFAALAGEERKSIDIVFCMDLSGSTNGLLDDTRDLEWELINQVNTYRPQPVLRIGIVAFSRPTFGKETGYVKILCPLTTDYEQF